MRFGVCAGVDAAPILAEAGYDYIELSVAADLAPETDDSTWSAHRHRIEQMPLPVEAFNSFVRSGKIVGPEADFERLRRYVNTALERAARLGAEIIVFGSGGARHIPNGFDRAVARQQILDFLHLCADASERTGVKVAIEPLNRRECNVLNLVSEGAAYAREVARPGVGVLADTFHMECESEPLDAILAAADILLHVHTADTHRYAPGTGSYDYEALFRTLYQCGYNRRLSIECDFQGKLATLAAPALSRLKAAYAAAYQGNAQT
ncbi:MAG TPA: sugar phosphate isomerase/epimerase family protein [Chthonomonas sp.]|uniref:sugar phosphate isomerase/epimerase family protein n=1 Tax=Chthonomonas sp. TaxID=2282153 RepID=UPI002B4AF5ED|nr:sugar phosphate isomerase/epimerase family protein [Chthonomonas sp.]HLI47226.1 sugar phosphate isomerase/epimerase family protein [Chthonomonas sp.]